MVKSSIMLVLTTVMVSMVAAKADAAGSGKPKPLRDGFVLSGIDGKLSKQDNNDLWFFEFDSDVSDSIGQISAGSAVELLPSAVLEKMIADASNRSDASPVRSELPGATSMSSARTSNGVSYRLWGRVTKYRGKNFIFPIYFLPFGKINGPKSPTSDSLRKQESKLAINDPNDILTIPKELIEKLQTRRVVRTEQLLNKLELKQDSVLADRTGFLNQQDDGYAFFVLDALGRNVQRMSLRLLPCQALERAERKQSAEPEQIRYKIAGIVTRYKGNRYLLLQRAIRVYSYGNFGR